MLTFTEYMKEYKDYTLDEIKTKRLTEANIISSTLAIKQQNNALRYGKDVLRSKRVEDKLDALARLGVSVANLSIIAVAVSGEASGMSKLAQGLSLRSI